jgi:hypothetical protein
MSFPQLCEENLDLDISNDYARIFAYVDSFVVESEGNDTIGSVSLFPYVGYPRSYALWDKVGQGVGNLKALAVLNIHLYENLFNEPDWEILACILSHIQNKIELQIIGGDILGAEEMLAFAAAIQGHPSITRFQSGCSFENAAALCSALTTLPNLESSVLEYQEGRQGEVATLWGPESVTEFLRAPALRIVEFRFFYFTSLLCEAIATALKQGSSIISLTLHSCCFPEGGHERIASALEENATLTTFQIFLHPFTIHQGFYDAMAASLLSNSTLQDLAITNSEGIYPYSVNISSILLALGMNKTLRKLHVSGFSSVPGSLIPALREGLGRNSTLEILEFIHNGCLDVAHATETSFYIAVVGALQSNKTIKTLRLCYNHGTPTLNSDDVKHLTSVVKKKYGLESLPALDSDDRMEDLRSILRLKKAGRGYLLDGHGSFVSKGVDVLIAVSDDLNCVFLHLLENPSFV